MITLRISVSEENIRAGSRPPHKWCDKTFCPVYQSIKDIIPGAEVGMDAIVVQGTTVSIPLPYIARNFIKWYSELKPDLRPLVLEPFEFEIEVPDSLLPIVNTAKLLKSHLSKPLQSHLQKSVVC